MCELYSSACTCGQVGFLEAVPSLNWTNSLHSMTAGCPHGWVCLSVYFDWKRQDWKATNAACRGAPPKKESKGCALYEQPSLPSPPALTKTGSNTSVSHCLTERREEPVRSGEQATFLTLFPREGGSLGKIPYFMGQQELWKRKEMILLRHTGVPV